MSREALTADCVLPGATVPFELGGLRGECVPLLSGLALEALPWHLRCGQTARTSCGLNVCGAKYSQSRQVLLVELPDLGGGMQRVYVKRYLSRGVLRSSFASLGHSRARREWTLGWEAIHHGVPTPEPALWAERRIGGLLRECYFASREAVFPGSFRSLWGSSDRDDARVGLLRELMPFIRHTHDRGFVHVDLRAKHVLAAPAPSDSGAGALRFMLIDLDRGRLARGEAGIYARMSSLYWLFSSLRLERCAGELREAFFDAYFGEGWSLARRRLALCAAWVAFRAKELRVWRRRGRRRALRARRRLKRELAAARKVSGGAG